MALVTRNLNSTASPLTKPDGSPLSNTIITFTIVDGTTKEPIDVVDATTTQQVVGEVIAKTNSIGAFSIEIWPNSRGNISTLYRVVVDQKDFDIFYASINDISAALDWVIFKLGTAPLPIADVPVLSDVAAYAAAASASASLAMRHSSNNDITIVDSAAAARLITPVVGERLIVTSSDGGEFNAKVGAAAGTYTDNGGAYCGTEIIPTGGDGSSAWVRDYSGILNILWFIDPVLHQGIKDETDTTDLSSYIDRAINYAINNSIRNLYAPFGKYNHSLPILGSITTTARSFHFYGDGYKTKFISSGLKSVELSRDSADDNNSPHTDIHLTDMYCTSEYDGAIPAGNYAGILFEFCDDSSVERVYMDKADDGCIRFSGYRKGIVSQVSSLTNPDFGYAKRNKILDCLVDNGKLGIELVGGVDCDIIDSTVLDAALHGMRLAGGGWGSLITGNKVITCQHSALYISNVKNAVITGNPNITSNRPTTPTALSLFESRNIIITENGFTGLVGDAILSVGGDESIGVNFSDNDVSGDVDFWYTKELVSHDNNITGYARIKANSTGAMHDNIVGSLLAPLTTDLVQGGGLISYAENKLRSSGLPALPGTQSSILGSALIPPSSGTFRESDIIINSSPTNYIGWVCTLAGTPGTWKEFGIIASAYNKTVQGRVTGSGVTSNLLTFTVPNGDYSIRFVIDLMISRAPSATPAQSRIIKHEITVTRTTGAGTIIDTALATNNFEVLTATAGGATTPGASNITGSISSGGITAAQTINITADLSGGFVYGVFNIESSSTSDLSVFGI